MLKPAQLYREELQEKLIEAWYNPKYQYYFSGAAYTLSIPDNNEFRHDFVHLDKDGNIDGYFSYQIDWKAKSLYNFGLIGFKDKNGIFMYECINRLWNFIQSEKIKRAEFWAWADNPVIEMYDRIVDRFYPLGYRAGKLTRSGFFGGEYHNSIIYEILF